MIHLYFLLVPGSLLLDAIGPAEVFAYANRLVADKAQPPFTLHFIGPEPELQNSLSLMVSLKPLPDSIPENAWLIIPGFVGQSSTIQPSAENALYNWLQHQHFQKYISICSGALLLAKAGLLSGKKCTTHYSHIDELKSLLSTSEQKRPIQIEKQVLENRLFIDDGNVATSAGITSGIDLALYLVQQTCSPTLATEIARKMVLFTRRGSQDPSYSPWLEHRNHIHNKIHLVQDAIQANPTKAWTLAELAHIAHCSERHLVRLFKAETKLTTKEYIYRLRLVLVKQFLEETTLPVENIAYRCGFSDDRQLRRLWSRHYPKPPSAYRQVAS